MSGFALLPSAYAELDAIYDYTRGTWGIDQAEKYVGGLFDWFAALAERQTPWRPIPPEFEVSGYFSRYEKHFIYFRKSELDGISIVTILHVSMMQGERLKSAFGG